MVMTFFFFYISLGYAKRLEAIGNTYSNLIDTLPKQYRRVKIEDINGKVFQLRLSKLIIIIMTIALLIIGIIMLQA